MKIAKMNVELVDYMGSDLSVVNAARVSFDKQSELIADPGCSDNGPFLTIHPKDVKLIQYLAKHNHWSPFAHTSISLRIKAPIFIARQLVKHQVGGVWNEVSRRYVSSEPEFWFPNQWRAAPEGSMKQGSSGIIDDPVEAGLISETLVDEALYTYFKLLSLNVAPEQARMVLPQNTMTEWVWTGSVMFFARVCKQRLDSHSQKESQEIAKKISDIVELLFPVSWKELIEIKND